MAGFSRHRTRRAIRTLLAGIIHAAIAALPIARRMRWGAHTTEFVRPVHGAVLLYGEEVVEIEVLGLTTGRVTLGTDSTRLADIAQISEDLRIAPERRESRGRFRATA